MALEAVGERAVQGLAELDAALAEFPDLLVRKMLRSAYAAGLKVWKEEALRRVPVKSGDLRASIRVSTSNRNGVVKGFLKAGNKKAFYAHWVEFGTAAHFIAAKNVKALSFALMTVEGVHNPGARKEPFMRPAFDAGSARAIEAFADYLRKRIDKETLTSLRSAPDEQDIR